jgi:hypothetical protein
VRSDGGDKGQTWAVLYDDGMSLTTASERVARSLAEAEHRRGHRVTVRLLDDAETRPRDAEKPISEPGCPNRPARPRLRDAAGSWSMRSLPSASSSRPRWPLTGVCCPGSVRIPAPARLRSAVLPIARS